MRSFSRPRSPWPDGFDFRPSQFQPFANSKLWDACNSSPFGKCSRFSFNCEKAIVPFIVSLLDSCSPTAICWTVRAVNVDAINRIVFWRRLRAHRFYKVFVALFAAPFVAHSNTPTSIIQIRRVFRVMATINHHSQNCAVWFSGIWSIFIFSARLPRPFEVIASAGLRGDSACLDGVQGHTAHFFDCSTFALTKPICACSIAKKPIRASVDDGPLCDAVSYVKDFLGRHPKKSLCFNLAIENGG